VLIYGQQQMGLGDLAPGAERTVQLSLLGATTAPIPTPDPLFPPAVIIPNPLINDPGVILGTNDYFNDPVAYPRWQLIQSHYDPETFDPAALPEPAETITLGGWLPGGALQASLAGGDARLVGQTLLLLEITVR
jgi:hypothetical protein